MTAIVADRRPPRALVCVLNPVARAVLCSPFGRFIAGLAVLQFEGRRTQHRYRIVIGWHELDGRGVVFTPARWRANFAGGLPLRVRHQGMSWSGRGELDTDPSVVADAINRVLDGGTSPRSLGLHVPPGHRLTSAEAEALGRALIRVSRDPAGSSG